MLCSRNWLKDTFDAGCLLSLGVLVRLAAAAINYAARQQAIELLPVVTVLVITVREVAYRELQRQLRRYIACWTAP